MLKITPKSTLRTASRAALFAVAAIGATAFATAGPASAWHRHHGPGLSIHLGGGYGIAHPWRHHGRVLVVGDGGCGWLYRRAVRTGSGYWWDRYEACRYGY